MWISFFLQTSDKRGEKRAPPESEDAAQRPPKMSKLNISDQSYYDSDALVMDVPDLVSSQSQEESSQRSILNYWVSFFFPLSSLNFYLFFYSCLQNPSAAQPTNPLPPPATAGAVNSSRLQDVPHSAEELFSDQSGEYKTTKIYCWFVFFTYCSWSSQNNFPNIWFLKKIIHIFYFCYKIKDDCAIKLRWPQYGRIILAFWDFWLKFLNFIFLPFFW